MKRLSRPLARLGKTNCKVCKSKHHELVKDGLPTVEENLTEEWKKGAGGVAESGLALNSKKKVYSVYVGNLPATVSKQDLAELFQGVGPIHNIFVATPLKDMKFTYGFIRFLDKACMEKTIVDFQGWEFRGNRLRVETSKESGQVRVPREPLMRGERPQHKFPRSVQRHPDDDLILWKVKQLCFDFNNRQAEYARNLTLKNVKQNPGPMSPVSRVDLPSLLKEASQADPWTTPVVRYEIPRVTLDLDAFDKAFNDESKVENAPRESDSGILEFDYVDWADLDDSSEISPNILPSITHSLSIPQAEAGHGDNGKNFAPGVYELNSDNTDVHRLTAANEKYSNLRCTITPSGKRVVTDMSSLKRQELRKVDGSGEKPDFTEFTSPTTCLRTPPGAKPPQPFLGRSPTDTSGFSPKTPPLREYHRLPKIAMEGSSVSSSLTPSPPSSEPSTASPTPTSNLKDWTSKITLSLPLANSGTTLKLNDPVSTWNNFEAVSSEFHNPAVSQQANLAKSLYSNISESSEFEVYSNVHRQSVSPKYIQNCHTVTGFGESKPIGRGRGVLAISNLDGMRKCGEQSGP